MKWIAVLSLVLFLYGCGDEHKKIEVDEPVAALPQPESSEAALPPMPPVLD